MPTTGAAGTGGGLRSGSNDPQALIQNALHPGQNAQQQDAGFYSVTPSPNYSTDRTAYASGALTYGCAANCATIFRTQDAGASWQRLPSVGFLGGTILLPPDYSADRIIFAVGAAGLQRSDDAGGSFRTVVPTAPVAAVSPSSPRGDPRVLVGTVPLVWYDSALGAVEPGPVLPPTVTSVSYLAFGAQDAALVSGYAQDPLASSGLDAVIVRCTNQCAISSSYPGEPALALRLSPAFVQDTTMVAFSNTRVQLSVDGGASFSRLIRPPGSVSFVAIVPDYRATHGMLMGMQEPTGVRVDMSWDGGSSFVQPSSSGLLGLQVAQVIALGDGRWLAALSGSDGTRDFGLRCSTDQGASWRYSC